MNTERTTMNGKPVITLPSKTVLNMESGFKHKLLCDGPTFSTGTACAYSCSFCYVPAAMHKLVHDKLPAGHTHEQVVIRRENAMETLYQQLTVKAKGGGRKPKYDNPNDRRVIFASPLVDVAANMDLVRETVEACCIILEQTHWHIRLLSKSNLLPKVAELIMSLGQLRGCSADDVRARMIFGVSTGTLDDKLATAFEAGCPKVSKRIESLHWLQDEGFRTFGMICPSLPQKDYIHFAMFMAEALCVDKLEHVWAEVINIRGDSMTRTVKAIQDAGFRGTAEALRHVSNDAEAWEAYARNTFMAHTACIPPEKLRFLQYVTKPTLGWWTLHQDLGAVLLGAASH